jgi:hypothetical protein
MLRSAAEFDEQRFMCLTQYPDYAKVDLPRGGSYFRHCRSRRRLFYCARVSARRPGPRFQFSEFRFDDVLTTPLVRAGRIECHPVDAEKSGPRHAAATRATCAG